MIVRNGTPLLLLLGLFVLSNASAPAQSQTTGRIAGTVKDQSEAVLTGAEVTVVSQSTREERKVTTDPAGNYAVPLLPPGTYQVSITASGFREAQFDQVQVVITETTTLNAGLAVGAITEKAVMIRSAGPLVQTDGPKLGRVVDSRAVAELPLATRNFTLILMLSPGR